MKVSFRTVIAVTVTSLTASIPVFADSTEDKVIEQQKEDHALKESHELMKHDLDEIRKLLESGARAATAPAKPARLPAPKPFEPRDVIITGAPVMGNANAGVTLIGYSDYQCPYCARHFRQTMPKIIEHYIERGRVKFVIREFPIPNLYPRATAASHAALCAGGQDRYWEMSDILFGNQSAVSDDDLRRYAAEIGLDTDRFISCLEQEEYAEQIEKDIEEGNEMGVRGTPSFALGLTDPVDADRIEITKFVYGARNYDFFAKRIDELLAEGAETELEAQP